MWATQRQIKAARKGRALRLVVFFCGTRKPFPEQISPFHAAYLLPPPPPAALFGKWRTIGGRKFNFAFLLSIDEIAPFL